MPDISIPEVRLKSRLPEGLRDMSVEDIQGAMPEVHLPKVELPKLDIDLGREAGRAARRADKAAKQARRSAGREATRAVRAVESALPTRRGPNPVAIAILAMLGGIVVGWLLATNPATGPRVRGWLDSIRKALFERSSYDEDEWDTTDAQAYPASLRAPIEPERYSGTLSESETGVGVGPGELPPGMGTTEPDQVGAGNGSGVRG